MASRRTGARAASTDAEPEVAGKTELDRKVTRLHQETSLWQSFLYAHRQIVDALTEQMKTDHQLPLESFDVLIHLADVPGQRLRQRDLRDRLLLSESGVSRMLARMAEAGLIERRSADEDRRGVEIALTSAGAAALAAAVDSHVELVARLFTDRLTVTDQVALGHILSKLDLKA